MNLLRTTNLTNFTNWLAQTGFYEHESHESHELAYCAGKNHGDIFFVFKNNIVINSFPV